MKKWWKLKINNETNVEIIIFNSLTHSIISISNVWEVMLNSNMFYNVTFLQTFKI